MDLMIESIDRIPLNWPIIWRNTPHTCLTDFHILNEVSLKQDSVNGARLVELLSAPLYITNAEKEIFEAALALAPAFDSPTDNDPANHLVNRFVVILHNAAGSLAGYNNMIAAMVNYPQRLFRWSWQKKLLFIMLITFDNPPFSGSVMENYRISNPELMPVLLNPRISGMLISIIGQLQWIKGPLISVGDDFKRKDRLMRGIVNFYDYNHRLHSGLKDAPDVKVHNLAATVDYRERFYFYSLAKMAFMYRKPPIPDVVRTGLIRFMFSIQETGSKPLTEVLSERFSEGMCEMLAQSPTAMDYFDFAYDTAKKINSFLQRKMVDTFKQHAIGTALLDDMMQFCPDHGNSIHCTGIRQYLASEASDAFPCPYRFLPYRTQSLTFPMTEAILKQRMEYVILDKLRRMNTQQLTMMIVEHQIARPMFWLIEHIQMVMGMYQTNEFHVFDLEMDADGTPKVLIVAGNDLMMTVKCITFAYAMSQVPVQSQEAIQTTGFLAMLEFMANCHGMFGVLIMLRIVLIRTPLNRLLNLEEVTKMQQHAKIATKLLDTYFFRTMESDTPHFYKTDHPMSHQMTVFQFFYSKRNGEAEDPGFSAYQTIIGLLLMPFTKDTVISVQNAKLLQTLARLYSDKLPTAQRPSADERLVIEKHLYDHLIDVQFTGRGMFNSDTVPKDDPNWSPTVANMNKFVLEMLTKMAAVDMTSLMPGLAALVLMNSIVPVIPLDSQTMFSIIGSRHANQFRSLCQPVGSGEVSFSVKPGQNHTAMMSALILSGWKCAGFTSDYKRVIDEIEQMAKMNPSLSIYQHSFAQHLCLPEYLHGGEVVSPAVSSFLSSADPRNHGTKTPRFFNSLVPNMSTSNSRQKRRQDDEEEMQWRPGSSPAYVPNSPIYSPTDPDM